MAKKKVTDLFPANCCGACYFSKMEEKDLVCYGLPPFIHINELDEASAHRGVHVQPEDKDCWLFKPKEHS